MSKKDEALKLALEALETGKNHGVAIDVLRRALAEQREQQKPVAWMVDVDLANYQGQSEYRTILAWNAKPVHSGTHEINEVLKAVPLYTSPQPASKPLTDEQIEQCMKQAYATVQGRNLEHAFARAIEAAHGITGEQS